MVNLPEVFLTGMIQASEYTFTELKWNIVKLFSSSKYTTIKVGTISYTKGYHHILNYVPNAIIMNIISA